MIIEINNLEKLVRIQNLFEPKRDFFKNLSESRIRCGLSSFFDPLYKNYNFYRHQLLFIKQNYNYENFANASPYTIKKDLVLNNHPNIKDNVVNLSASCKKKKKSPKQQSNCSGGGGGSGGSGGGSRDRTKVSRKRGGGFKIFLMKILIAGGLTYGSIYGGVWGTAEESERFLQNVKNMLNGDYNFAQDPNKIQSTEPSKNFDQYCKMFCEKSQQLPEAIGDFYRKSSALIMEYYEIIKKTLTPDDK